MNGLYVYDYKVKEICFLNFTLCTDKRDRYISKSESLLDLQMFRVILHTFH